MPRIYCTVLIGLLVSITSGTASAQNWPRFRGPDGAGVSDGQQLPARWDIASGRNIVWQREIPGSGHSSPIIWENRIFLSTAVGEQDLTLQLGKTGGIDLAEDGALQWKVVCVDKGSGEILWEQTPYRGRPRAHRHVKASQANATLATDGRYVVAILGSQGMAVFDLDGELQWTKDLGQLDPGLWKDPTSQWGHASSPVIDGDRVFVQVDRHRDSYIAAYRLSDGEQLWRRERDELPVWSSPLIVESGDRTELVVNGGNYIRSYDPATGRELWSFHDFAEVKTPTPFYADGKVIVTGGYPGGRPIFAFRPGLEGNVSLDEGSSVNAALFWNTERYSGYTPTPLLYRGRLYSLDDNGVLAVLDGNNGALQRQLRLGGNYSASPVASDGRVYFCSEDGEAVVIEADSLEELGRMELNAPCMATPAISDDRLFVRTQQALYAIGSESSASMRR